MIDLNKKMGEVVAVSVIDLNISKNVFVPLYYPYLFNYDNRYEVYYGGR